MLHWLEAVRSIKLWDDLKMEVEDQGLQIIPVRTLTGLLLRSWCPAGLLCRGGRAPRPLWASTKCPGGGAAKPWPRTISAWPRLDSLQWTWLKYFLHCGSLRAEMQPWSWWPPTQLIRHLEINESKSTAGLIVVLRPWQEHLCDCVALNNRVLLLSPALLLQCETSNIRHQCWPDTGGRQGRTDSGTH